MPTPFDQLNENYKAGRFVRDKTQDKRDKIDQKISKAIKDYASSLKFNEKKFAQNPALRTIRSLREKELAVVNRGLQDPAGDRQRFFNQVANNPIKRTLAPLREKELEGIEQSARNLSEGGNMFRRFFAPLRQRELEGVERGFKQGVDMQRLGDVTGSTMTDFVKGPTGLAEPFRKTFNKAANFFGRPNRDVTSDTLADFVNGGRTPKVAASSTNTTNAQTAEQATRKPVQESITRKPAASPVASSQARLARQATPAKPAGWAPDYNKPYWWQQTEGLTPEQQARMPIETIRGIDRRFFGPSAGREFFTPRAAFEGTPEAARRTDESALAQRAHAIALKRLENQGQIGAAREKSRGLLEAAKVKGSNPSGLSKPFESILDPEGQFLGSHDQGTGTYYPGGTNQTPQQMMQGHVSTGSYDQAATMLSQSTAAEQEQLLRSLPKEHRKELLMTYRKLFGDK